MVYHIFVKGSNSARVIQEIKLNADIKIDSDKLKFPLPKLQQIESELEQIIEKYFESCDWLPNETGIKKYW